MSAPKRSNFDDVGDFHKRFELDSVTHRGAHEREIDSELLGFRLNFLLEELGELAEAVGAKLHVSDIVVGGVRPLAARVPDNAPIDHAKAFDALIDLVYVALGTAQLMGYPWQKGWDLVQGANMAKVRAQADGSDSLRGSSFDVVKPEGWTAPDIEALLTAFGFPTSLNNEGYTPCNTCGIVKVEHHSEIDHSYRKTQRR